MVISVLLSLCSLCLLTWRVDSFWKERRSSACHFFGGVTEFFFDDDDESVRNRLELQYKRIIDYVEDSCKTFANIVDNFIPGEVYNVGGGINNSCSIFELKNSVGFSCDNAPHNKIK